MQIEAVTSHGSVNAKRWKGLRCLFLSATVSLVSVTTFLTRKVMVEYLADIS